MGDEVSALILDHDEVAKGLPPASRDAVVDSQVRSQADVGGGLWSRLRNPVVLATEVRRMEDGGLRRARLLQVEGKYPLVVFKGTLPAGDENAPDDALEDTTAAVADHVIVRPREGMAEAEFRKAVEAAGLRLGERLAPDGPFLVHSPSVALDAVEKAMAVLQASGSVTYAEPDFLVHASDIPESRMEVDELDGVARYEEAALDANTIRPPECPMLSVASQEADVGERLLDLPPGARIVTFDAPNFLGGPGSYNPYMEEQNMVLSTSTGMYLQAASNTGYPNNGTIYARSLSSQTSFTVKHREDLPFTILSLDLAEYSTVFPYPKSVTFTGYRASGGTVSQTFTTDGVIDGTGALADFQTFSFNSSFTNLTKVVANPPSFMVDNIAVIVEGQETTPPAPPEPPLLYDVTWDTPIHQVNQLTAVGGGFAPTSINFGTPTVRSQIGTMAGPALEFNGSGYQQTYFAVRKGAEAYRLECDVYMDLPVDFTLFFDGAGGVQRLDFKPNGTIGAFQSYVASPATLGTYPVRQKTRIAVDVDMLAAVWEVFVDGISKYRGPFDVSGGDLSGIRFHEVGNSTGRAGVDNVRIFAYGEGNTLPDGPRIAVSPAALFFPAVPVGGSKTWYVTIRNSGSESLEIQNVVSGNSHFVVSGSYPVSLLPGGMFSVAVAFRPQAVGPLSGSLAITSNDPSRPLLTVPLSGTGLGLPQITLDPPGLDVTMVANTTGTRNFTVANTGQGTLTWNLTLKGAGSSHEPPSDPSRTPDDSLFGSLWAMQGAQGGRGGIDAVHAWSVTTGSASNIIAVIDTGVDHSHPELQGNMWTNPGEIPGNGIDDDHNDYIDDVNGWDFSQKDNDPSDGHGHGTHVAGTIAARGDNALGVSGVCWNARIMAVKFLSDSGSGYTSDAVAAVSYARRMAARITNNSWGGSGFSQALHDAIQTAGQADSLFVAAAGNNNANNDSSPHYPSSYDLECIVSVAATNENDGLSYFSNYGAYSVDLAAPGSNILSLRPGGQYLTSSGTSMAAPHVAGVAALLLSQNPTLKPALIKQLLMFGADSLSTLGSRVACDGRLNAYRALKATVPQWLKPQIVSGTVPAGGSQIVPLALDTATLAPGNYNQTIAVSSNDPSRPVLELPVVLKVLPSKSFNEWLVGNFASDQMLPNVMESTQWSLSADPDGDQMCNLIEFITGNNPVIAEPENVPSMVRHDGENLFEFRVKASMEDASYRIEWTPDLSSHGWRSDGITTVHDSTDGMPAGIHRLRVKLTDAGVSSAFFRLVGVSEF